MDSDVPPVRRPRSASSLALSLVALLAGLCVGAFAQRNWPDDPLMTVLCGGGAVAITLALGELFLLKASRRPSTGLAERALRPFDFQATCLRLLGFCGTLAVIALAYWAFPEYRGRFYRPYWYFLENVAWPTACIAPLYFLWIGRRLQRPEDAYLQLGSLLIGRGWSQVDRNLMWTHWTGWAVKAFFLPLMVVYLNGEVHSVAIALRDVSWDTMHVYKLCFELSYFVDLLFCVVGYSLTLRVLNSHIRSTEPTAFGWLVALVCYQPFYSVIGNFYLRYDESGIFWDAWLAAYPTLRAIWAAAIIFLTSVYALSTVSFGPRFSNLTHRGIITGGPYRFTKHPAYISKNLSWWLISIPFVSHDGWLEALRHCMLLGGLNFIYFLRARTEERHLSRDPEYVAYAQWIRAHGMFARLRRLLGRQRLAAPALPRNP
jgi:hypothetical protein